MTFGGPVPFPTLTARIAVIDFLTSTSTIQIEFLEIISDAEVSLTYFLRMCQYLSSLFAMTAKNVYNISLVPCGTPPLTCFFVGKEEPTRKACV